MAWRLVFHARCGCPLGLGESGQRRERAGWRHPPAGRVTLSGPCAGQRVEAQASGETSFALGADRGAAERAAASALLERTIDDAVASWSRRCEEGDGDT